MKKFLFNIALFIPLFGIAQVRINEIMPANVSAVWDDAYNFSMWVEIYNGSATSINRSDFYFTDNLSEPTKWHPDTTVIVGVYGFDLLWFERDDRPGHANFELDADGGKLYMLNSSLQVVDSVIYPKQHRNVSYGRKTNGGAEWTFFSEYSPGTSNNDKKWTEEKCDTPKLSVSGGFYTSTQHVQMSSSLDSTFYTFDGSEPKRTDMLYMAPITISETTVLRVKRYSPEKQPSEIVSATYFINERDFNLPVVSITTNPEYLNDDIIGIYVVGTNGITGNGMTVPANWNQDWDRPANFELYDTTLVSRLNQELDISIAGGWTRMNGQKSLKVNPRKKHGNSKLDYDIFVASKPNMKFKSILYRNSGNDFAYSMLRDGFMQSLVANRMDIDWIAYEPSVSFLNGQYWGIQNLRERSNEDHIYSNYGLDKDEIYLVERFEMETDPHYLELTDYVSNNDITNPTIYTNVCEIMDVESFMNYFMTEIYYGNTDWPDNNVKAWKKIDGGKWRWILFDTDFGYNLYNTSLYTHNSLLYALGELTSDIPMTWSTLLMKRLVLNSTFRQKFIDRFCIHISSTFEYDRSTAILDSLAAKISNEIVYHKNLWGSARGFNADISNIKTFAQERPANMLSFISNRFMSGATIQTINISSNNSKATYKFNDEKIIDADINLSYFNGQSISLQANPVPAFEFKQWEIIGSQNTVTLVPNGSIWKYFDGSSIPAENWYAKDYDDSSWESGSAQLGYGGKGEVTTISYGDNPNNKYPTAYFRKTFSMTDLSSKYNFTVSTFFDDGVAVYVNGTEIGRNNMPTGTLTFNTYSTTYNNGVTANFSIPQELLVEGNNVIAAEVHQVSASSSDLIFNLQMTHDEGLVSNVITTPVYTTTLTGAVTIRAVYEQTIFEDPEEGLDVVINEVVSSNNIIPDEFGETDDYIEIYNNGDEEVNIAGWYISDVAAVPTLVQIPTTDSLKTAIPAQGRLVLWADDQPEQGILHLGFKLSQAGETLVLSKTNYLGSIVLVDSVTFGYLEQNTSYSRVPDGADNWMVRIPTCNATNGDIDDGVIEVDMVSTRVYPTLVVDYITIENAADKQMRIFNLTGKIILEHNCYEQKEILNVSNLQQGIYIITIEDENFKFIKQ